MNKNQDEDEGIEDKTSEKKPRSNYIRDVKSIKLAIAQIIQIYGGIDVLISNAGTAFQGKIYDVKEEIIRKSFEINFFSHQKITQEVIEIMKLQNFGGNVQILSKQGGAIDIHATGPDSAISFADLQRSC